MNFWLRFDVFIFYDWPFLQTYLAKNVANSFSLLIVGSVFSDCVVFYWDMLGPIISKVGGTRPCAGPMGWFEPTM